MTVAESVASKGAETADSSASKCTIAQAIREAANTLACNAVNIGDRVILNQASDPLKARLMLAGFHVHEVELSEFLKAGGSAKCLTLKLSEPKKGA